MQTLMAHTVKQILLLIHNTEQPMRHHDCTLDAPLPTSTAKPPKVERDGETNAKVIDTAAHEMIAT